MSESPHYEVLIVGGGPAGLAAALTFGRLRRRVLLCDDGQPRNQPAARMYNFPGADGMPPARWREKTLKDLAHYPSLSRQALRVQALQQTAGGFEALLADGSTVQGQKVLLAYGLRDRLPEIKNIQALWGQSVAHCPYCHGFEFQDQALGLLADGPLALHLLALLRGLSADLMLFSHGPSVLAAAERQQLDRLTIPLYESPVLALQHQGPTLEALTLASGENIPRQALFIGPLLPMARSAALGETLGCQLTELGSYAVDATGKTSVPGVYAAGDLAGYQGQSVLFSAASGSRAAANICAELLGEAAGFSMLH